MMNRKEIEELKRNLPKGTKVRLIRMDDRQAPPKGTVGEVTFVDDAGQIHMKWSTGSTLALIVGEDEFEVL